MADIVDPHSLTDAEIVSQTKLLDTMTKNKKDESKFLNAWIHIENEIKDESAISKLRGVLLDKYVNSKDVTIKDTEEMENAINMLDDDIVRKDMFIILYSRQNTSKEYNTQLSLVTNMVKNKKDNMRFMTGWKHINDKIKDKNAESKLRIVVVDQFVSSKFST